MSRSLWEGIDRRKFYEDCALVKRKFHDCPGTEEEYDHKDWKRLGNHDGKNELLFNEERNLVSNLAFFASASKNANCVCSVIVEEIINQKKLVFYAAANSGISGEVEEMINSIMEILENCARSGMMRMVQHHRLSADWRIRDKPIKMCKENIIDQYFHSYPTYTWSFEIAAVGSFGISQSD